MLARSDAVAPSLSKKSLRMADPTKSAIPTFQPSTSTAMSLSR